jgi:tetratricopeptide (TPR) repeat protein
VGEALERVRGGQREAAAELARHFMVAGHEERAIRYFLLAGDHAAGLQAHGEAALHYETALELSTKAGDEGAAVVACEKLGPELRLLGRFEAALAVLERAAARRRATGDLEGLGRVTAEIGQVMYGFKDGLREGVPRLQGVLALLDARGPSAALLALHDALAYLHLATGRYADYLVAGERAAELARALGESRMVAEAGFHRAHALQLLGRVLDALQVSEQTIAWAQETGGALMVGGAFSVKGYTLVFRGDLDIASRAIHQAIATFERLGDSLRVAMDTAVARHLLFLVRGEWAKGRDSLEQVSGTLDGTVLSTYPELALGTLCLAEGQWEEANRHLVAATAHAALADDMQGLRHAARALAELDILVGRPDAARARLEPLLDRPGLEEFDVTYFLPVLAWAYLEAGDGAHAEQTIGQALRRARAEQLCLMLVDALRVQAMVAARQEHWQEAEQALEEGIALARSMPYPYAEARLLHQSGQLCAQLGQAVAAQQHLEAALAIFQQLGAAKDIEQVERNLAACATGR